MKKSILSILLLLQALILSAAVVPQNKAFQVACSVFGVQPTKAESSIKMVWDGQGTMTKGGQSPAFYVFNRTAGGFVIVAGDDVVKPVLAYSKDHEFVVEDMPDNVRWWMNQIQDYIFSARLTNYWQSKEIAAKWDELSLHRTKSNTQPEKGVEPLLELHTAEWNQKVPFNNLTPKDASPTSPAGCVPVALAELLHYYKYPSRSTGWRQSYTYESDNVEYNIPSYQFGTIKYQWDKMLHNYKNEEYDSEQAYAVAQLILECGMAVSAKYGSDGTSASTSTIPARIVEHFFYSDDARSLSRKNYSDQVWTDMLVQELNAKRPLIYRGETATSGHAFIFDGYGTMQGDTYFYVNFGWSGSSNGFYSINELRKYNTDQAALFGLHPNPAGEVSSDLKIAGNLTCDHKKFRIGDTVKVVVPSIKNVGKVDFDGRLRVIACNSQGDTKYFSDFLSTTTTIPSGQEVTGKAFYCLISQIPAEGDYLTVVSSQKSDAANQDFWIIPALNSDIETQVELVGFNKLDDAIVEYVVSERKLYLTTIPGTIITVTDQSGKDISGIVSSQKNGEYVLSLGSNSGQITITQKKNDKTHSFKVIIKPQ